MRHIGLLLLAGTGCLGSPNSGTADAAPGETDATPLVACDAPDDCTGTPEGAEAACHCGACAYTDVRCEVPGLHYEGGDCVASPVQIDLGYHDACVTMSDGRAYCWGADDCGQLGDQREGIECGVSDDHSRVPVLVRESLDGPALGGVQAVQMGQKHTCAQRDGHVLCWGANNYGQIGTGEASDPVMDPSEVQKSNGALDRIEQLTAGYYFNCGLDTDGNGWCWGNNGRGQIGADDWIIEPTGGGGEPSDDLRPLAELVDSGFPFDLIVAGGEHACGTTRDINPREVWCWGRNVFGALGWSAGGSNASQGTPVHVLREPTGAPVALVGITPLGMGNRFSCAGRVAPDQTWCWGENAHHALGDEDVPAGVNGSTAWVARQTAQGELVSPPAQLDGGNDFACALLQNGSLYCWGNNADGQLGQALDPDDAPVAGPGLVMDNVMTMATGFDSACAIRKDRKIFCWGNNADGQLGTGDEVSASAPADVEQICP